MTAITARPGRVPADFVVVIDVIRAFTTACVLSAGGAAEVICDRDQAEAARAADLDARRCGRTARTAARPADG